MSNFFCEKTFCSYINSSPDIGRNRFYLTHSLLLRTCETDIGIRLEDGEWQTFTTSNICYLPKGKLVEIINNDRHHAPIVEFIPITDEMLKYFYQQHAALLIYGKTKPTARVCCIDLHENPIIENVFISARKEISASIATHKVNIYLNFILSFFLLMDDFIPILHASIHRSIKDKVYDLIFHNAGKQCCTLDVIAKKLHMSTSTLKRHLAREQTSFSKISLMSRMNKAMMLSKTNNLPMTRIAQEVGYDDVPYFLLTFKNFHNIETGFHPI